MDMKKLTPRSVPRAMSLFTKVAIVLFMFLLIVPLVTHYYISNIESADSSRSNVNGFLTRPEGSRAQFDPANELQDALQIKDLALRIKEMIRIRSSVSNELRSLEGKRQKLQSEISSLSVRLDDLKTEFAKKQIDLDKIRMSLEQILYDQKEANLKNQPILARPLHPLLPSEAIRQKPVPFSNTHFPPKSSTWTSCSMHNCFDYSRCSLTSGFPVYFYHPSEGMENDDDDNSDFGRENDVHSQDATRRSSHKSAVLDAFNSNAHTTFDPATACVYAVILLEKGIYRNNSKLIDSYLKKLPFWSDGLNHIIFNFIPNFDILEAGVNPGKAMVVQSQFMGKTYRNNFDVAIIDTQESLSLEEVSPVHCPARRKYLATYEGRLSKESALQRLVSSLEQLQSSSPDVFHFDFDATQPASDGEDILRQSTFALILPPENEEMVASALVNARLCAILRAGAVPVLFGGDYLKLPYDDVIEWNGALLSLPTARVTELHFLLRTISDSDILAMKRLGNLFLRRYLASTRTAVDTTLALIRQKRLQIPAPPARDEPAVLLFNASFPMRFFDPADAAVSPDSTEPEENLGPVEPPFASPTYQRNFSLSFTQGHSLWNDILLDPFATYPHTPFDPVLPSEAKFLGSPFGFRPIGGGTGGAGKEFSEALGGNVPKEQFTIVMLTYERETVLIDSLQRLKGLPHLNKILVVWNSPNKMPSNDMRWPDVGVPIEVVRTKRNSLNNRFKPFDEIETECILSMDDDAHLRHDEIIFGFRVWREARDRIVGFPGRFHAWDSVNNAFQYNSNYSCELSMVLTGAAFFHKYYSYLYSYAMPASIRDKVDEYVNCEDIAMNFLVSHVTRKPPIKVTSRWTFRCPGCPVSLSEDDSHFLERHLCINFFTAAYGYNPLLNTQHRADSVLFKTRIPHDKAKCFKFI